MSQRSDIELGYDEIEASAVELKAERERAIKANAEEAHRQRVFTHLLSGGLQCENSYCGAIEDVSKGPNPFAQEIYGDDTPTTECGECRHQSAMDI